MSATRFWTLESQHVGYIYTSKVFIHELGWFYNAADTQNIVFDLKIGQFGFTKGCIHVRKVFYSHIHSAADLRRSSLSIAVQNDHVFGFFMQFE